MIREFENKTLSELKSGDYFYEFSTGRLGCDFKKRQVIENNSKYTLINEPAYGNKPVAYQYKLWRAYGNVFKTEGGRGYMCIRDLMPYALLLTKQQTIRNIKHELNDPNSDHFKSATHVLNGIPCNVESLNKYNMWIKKTWTIEDHNHLLKLHNKQLEVLQELDKIINTWPEDYVDEKIVDDYLFKINKITEIIYRFVDTIGEQLYREISNICPWDSIPVISKKGYYDKLMYLTNIIYKRTLIPINEYKGEIKNHIYFEIDYNQDYSNESLVKQGIILSNPKIDTKTKNQLYDKINNIELPKDYPLSRYSEILGS